MARLASRLQKLASDKAASDGPDVVKPEEFRLVPWIKKYLKIRSQGEGLINLTPNKSQRKVAAIIVKNRKQKKPTRLIILKSRRQGASTWIQSVIFSLVTKFRDRVAQTIAHKRKSARTIHGMSKRFYYHLPKDMQIGLEGLKPGKDELVYTKPHDSEIHVHTAGTEDVALGDLVHYAHWSEFAMWRNAEELYEGIMQCVPKPNVTWDTIVVIESTANGTGNLFHQMWEDAQDPSSDWQPLFLSWKLDPTARMEISAGENFTLEADEAEFAAKYDCDMEQMKWVRWTKKNQCRNNWDRFNQWYPVSPELAFLFSGFPWFDQVKMQGHLEYAQSVSPIWEGVLEFGSVDMPTVGKLPMEHGPLKIWKWPEDNKEYVLGGDIAEGVKADFSQLEVVQTDPPEVVAEFRSNTMKPSAVGLQAFLLGLLYNVALVGIERNGPGLATLGVLESGHPEHPQTRGGYPNTYREVTIDKTTNEETHRIGFATARRSKERGLNNIGESILEEAWIIPSVSLCQQMKGFLWNPDKKKWAMNYKDPVSELPNDDGVMALMIANEMRSVNTTSRYFGKVKVVA